jgi:uncharacterized protein
MNRLANEQSPYLLQHAANPVDWYPWTEEAFARARDEHKPIFLSIGYSTCHWCHVMEHESFEDAQIAEILNREFVSIKVDREERPDVDRVYMTFVQATTGAGGWPMSVWLTPDLKPFYGGTYFPPRGQWGRPGFRDVLTELARAWRDDRLQVVQSASQIVERLTAMAAPAPRTGDNEMPGAAALATAVAQFRNTFDARRGGFGDGPKFPRPSELLFLLREYARTGDEVARDMVVRTLRSMALGGMRDHIGGGFHRYSVDGEWRVPHFEKMLYDQAQLVLAYLEAAQATGDAFFAQVAEDTLQYVERDLRDEAGGFHSAEDADSIPPEQAGADHPHKTEGAFYVWTREELRARLGDDSLAFELRYGVLADGNAPFDPQNEFTGKNLLYTARSIADIAGETQQTPASVADALTRARLTLFEARRERPRPHLDDKALTAWNGLMIAAFARASRVVASEAWLGESAGRAAAARHLVSAQRAAAFIYEVMWDAGRGILRRRYRRGQSAIDGYAEDYACLIFGLLELVEADGDVRWLDWAIELQQRQDALFGDETGGGWFSTTGTDPSVLVRLKEEYDGAEPSASAVGAWNLLALAQLTGEAFYGEHARAVFSGFAQTLSAQGRAVPMLAAALSMAHAVPEQVIVVGPRSDERTQRLWSAVNRRYRPTATTLIVEPGAAQDRLATRIPWIRAMNMMDGAPAAYVCRNFTCDAPTTDPDAI